jgi:hypothetical protein
MPRWVRRRAADSAMRACPALLLALAGGCVVVPIPALEETVLSGGKVAEAKVRASIVPGDSIADVAARLGKPAADLGPRRVHAYAWSVKKGTFLYAYGFSLGAGGAGSFPWTASRLFFVAFDAEGRALGTGTSDYDTSSTVTSRAREWLATGTFAAQVRRPRPGIASSAEARAFVYHPVDPNCPTSSFGLGNHIQSVAVDGRLAGDLAKGEYLGVDLSAGPHEITIEPAQRPHTLSVRARVTLVVDPGEDKYIEVRLCRSKGWVETLATERDAVHGLQALRNLDAAW